MPSSTLTSVSSRQSAVPSFCFWYKWNHFIPILKSLSFRALLCSYEQSWYMSLSPCSLKLWWLEVVEPTQQHVIPWQTPVMPALLWTSFRNWARSCCYSYTAFALNVCSKNWKCSIIENSSFSYFILPIYVTILQQEVVICDITLWHWSANHYWSGLNDDTDACEPCH